MSEAEPLETRDKAEAVNGSSQFWLIQLELSDNDHKDFITNGRAVVERYKAEQKAASTRKAAKRFNILWSNTETLLAALYARTAKPDVRRRFADKDPVARQVADIVERALVTCSDLYEVDKPTEAAVKDYLLPGRGLIRIDYEPVIVQQPVMDPLGQPMLGPDGKPAMQDYVGEQKLIQRYWFWEDFRHSPARRWDDVTWVAFRHLMTREQMVALDETEGAVAPLNWSPDAERRDRLPEDFKRAEVWEIWDKAKLERVWVVKGHLRTIKREPDPYQLTGFWPMAEPLQATTTSDTLIPQPDFHAYQDQADDLDEVTARISRLTKALKRRGVYDANVQELVKLATAADNVFTPVKNWAELQAKGGLAKAFETEDIRPIAEVLVQLVQQRQMLVQEIYEVTGVSDILRGQSDPNETLGAQQLKAQFGGNRIKKRQETTQKWIRDTLRLEAEMIAEHFEPQVLQEMTGLQVTPEIMQLLRSDRLRSFKIDVETDSTVFADAEAEKQGRVELVTAMTQFIGGWAPIIQAQPALMPLAFEMLSFAVRGFKAGRQLEEVIEQTRMQLEQAAQQAQQQAQQPPPPDPEQVKAEAAIEKTQLDREVAREGHAMKMEQMQVERVAAAEKAALRPPARETVQ